MKKQKWIITAALLSLTLLLAAYSEGRNKPSVITLDGSYELLLGKTSIKEVMDAGFTDRSPYSAKNTIPSMSWKNFYSRKNELSYGTMMAGNKSQKEIPLEEGVIFELSLDYNNADVDVGEVKIDGVEYKGYTREQIKEAMGDRQPYLDSEEFLSYKSKNCSYTFIFSDGSEILTGMWVDDGTEKEYIIK